MLALAKYANVQSLCFQTQLLVSADLGPSIISELHSLPLSFISHDVFAQSVLCKHFGKVIDRSKVLNRIIW